MSNSYSKLILDIKSDNIVSLNLKPKRREVDVRYKDGTERTISILPNDQYFLEIVQSNSVPLSVDYLKSEYISASVFTNFTLILIIITGLTYLLRIASKSIKNTFNFLDKSTQIVPKEDLKTTFDDVASSNEIKNELKEIVSLLLDRSKIEKLGGKPPKGVLLCGEPGTGKTLVARAIAGEAKVPFFNVSGSEFIELFIGVGANRVKNLFEKAKKQAPSIIFIDEIDSIGSQRGGGIGNGNDEREQTLNQILTEMDGYNSISGLVVIAATNRPEVLDTALTRPGRFDRIINLELPDKDSRHKILKLHSLTHPLDKNLSLRFWASITSGYSGASLKNLLNEGAINAGKNNLKVVSNKNLEQAFEKINFGNKFNYININQKRLLAYREISKVLIAKSIAHTEYVHKISIYPSLNKIGKTIFLSKEDIDDQLIYTKNFLISRLMILLAPRAAEIVVLGNNEITKMSSIEFSQVWNICKKMIEKFGFSKTNLVYINKTETNGLLLGSIFRNKSQYSQKTKKSIDREIIEMAKHYLSCNIKILSESRSQFDYITNILEQEETITGKRFLDLLSAYPKQI